MTTRVAIRAVIGAVLLLLLTAPASSAVLVGIADQKPRMFADTRFQRAGFHVVRLSIPWDALDHRDQRAKLRRWLEGARRARARPLITFGHASGDRRRVLPAPERLAAELRRIRRAYPWVREFATWNEANHCGEPTCHKPKLVARYHLALRKACPSCTILAAEVLDTPNMVRWVRDFTAALPPEMQASPIWGLHNYLDANRMRTKGTRALLRATTGEIWMTETGGIVRRTNVTRITFPESASHAAAATRWIFARLVPLSSRISRVYLYHWDAEPGATWDSGLIGEQVEIRPAFRVVRSVLQTPRG